MRPPMVLSGFVPQHSSSESPRQGVTPGDRVRQERVRRGWSQEHLAELADCHRNTIRNLEQNVSQSRRVVESIARALEMSPEALGFKLHKIFRVEDLTESQRDVLDRVLSLSPEKLEVVKAALRAVESETSTKKMGQGE